MNPRNLPEKFAEGLLWDDYLATDPEKGVKWREFYDRVELSHAQHELIEGFEREMHVLVISGIWCGDCVQQGPMLQRIAELNPLIRLRWIDRDEHLEFAELFKINQGLRVPVVIFMAEDDEPVSVLGDRTLSRYRAIVAKFLGPACTLPTAVVPENEIAATLQDWLDEFERVHLLLRLSGRLRQKHGD